MTQLLSSANRKKGKRVASKKDGKEEDRVGPGLRPGQAAKRPHLVRKPRTSYTGTATFSTISFTTWSDCSDFFSVDAYSPFTTTR